MTQLPFKDVVIVGGGIVGAFSAYFLSRLGFSCTILDPDFDARKASTCNPGGINPFHGPGLPGICSPLAELSFRLHFDEAHELSRLSATDYFLERIERIELAYSHDELDSLAKSLGKFDAIPGFSARILDRDELFKADPRIGPEAVGGLWSSGNGNVHSRLYTRAVLLAAQRQGVELLQGSLTGISTKGGRVESLDVGGDKITCGNVLLCNGPWASHAHQWFGTSVPIKPLKGEMLLVELPKNAPYHHVSWKQFGIYREPNQLAWLGGTLDASAGFDTSPTEAGRDIIIESVARMIPSIRDAKVVEHVAALRPITSDGLPILDRIGDLTNALIVGGCGPKGMLLSAGMGFCAAQWIANGSCDLSLKPFQLDRFKTLEEHD